MAKIASPTQAPAGPSRLTVFLLVLLGGAVVGGAILLAHLWKAGPSEFSLGIDLRKIDPALVRCRQVAQIETGMKDVRAIAVGSEGRVYVAGERVVAVLSADGKRQKSVTIQGTPTALAVGPGGKLYVGLGDHVDVLDANGQPIRQYSSLDGKGLITGISVNSAGDVAVADVAGKCVDLYLHGDGDPIRLGKGNQKFTTYSPHLDVALSNDGVLWVTNPGNLRIDRFDLDGKLLGSLGTAGTAPEQFVGCCNPSDIALMPDGGLVTSEKGVPRVKLYGPGGKFDGFVAPPADFREGDVLDVAADAAGRIYVLDPALKLVRIYEQKKGTTRP